MRRRLLGIIAVGILGLGAVICFLPLLAAYQAVGMAALRVGLVLGVLWLAWPDLDRLPRWTWFALPIGLVVLVYARGVLLYAAPLLAAVLAAYLVYRRLRKSS